MSFELVERDLSSLSTLSTKAFAKILKACCKVLAASGSSGDESRAIISDVELEALAKAARLSTDEMKLCWGLLLAVMADACRLNVAKEALSQSLLDCGLDNDELCEVFVAAFDKFKSDIRGSLCGVSIRIPQLVGVEWRLLQDIKQKEMSKVHRPRILIRFRFDNGSHTQFECGREEAQDLLSRLKVARDSVHSVIKSGIDDMS